MACFGVSTYFSACVFLWVLFGKFFCLLVHETCLVDHMKIQFYVIIVLRCSGSFNHLFRGPRVKNSHAKMVGSLCFNLFSLVTCSSFWIRLELVLISLLCFPWIRRGRLLS